MTFKHGSKIFPGTPQKKIKATKSLLVMGMVLSLVSLFDLSCSSAPAAVWTQMTLGKGSGLCIHLPVGAGCSQAAPAPLGQLWAVPTSSGLISGPVPFGKRSSLWEISSGLA